MELFALFVIYPLIFIIGWKLETLGVITLGLLIGLFSKLLSKGSYDNTKAFIASLLVGAAVFLALLLPGLDELKIEDQNYKPRNTGIADFVIVSPLIDSVLVYGALGVYSTLIVFLFSKLGNKISYKIINP